MSDELEAMWKEIRSLRARISHLEALEYIARAGIADTLISVGARVYNKSDISIPDSTWTSLPFDSERFDEPDGNIHSTVADTSKLVCRIAGTYVFFGGLRWATSELGDRYCWIYLNGTTTIAMHNRRPGGSEFFTISTPYKLEVEDFVELQVYQDTGGNLSVEAGLQYSPEFAMVRIA